MMLTLCSMLPAFIALKMLNCNGSLLQLTLSLIPRPPPFLPSVCVHNNTQEQNVILRTQTEGKNGGGLGTRLMLTSWYHNLKQIILKFWSYLQASL